MIDLLGKATWHSFKFHIAEKYNFNVDKPDEMIRNPELFEKVLTDLLGSGAPLVLIRINQKLIESFSIEHSENFAYSRFGDFSRVIKRLKNRGGKEKTKDVEDKHE